MRIVGLPVMIDGQGHSFKHNQFLVWLAETQSASLAKQWSSLISDYARSKAMEDQAIIQQAFERKYLEFCEAKGYDVNEVMFENPDKNLEKLVISARQRSNYVNIRAKEMQLWDVLDENCEAEVLIAEGSKSTLQPTELKLAAPTDKTVFFSYDEIVKVLENDVAGKL